MGSKYTLYSKTKKEGKQIQGRNASFILKTNVGSKYILYPQSKCGVKIHPLLFNLKASAGQNTSFNLTASAGQNTSFNLKIKVHPSK